MQRALIDEIWDRAKSCCEYCLLDAQFATAPFEIDHVLAQKHGGPTESRNLALSCFRCNSHKGACIAGIDPLRGRVTRLFNPRRDRWTDHFSWNGAVLVGNTAVGRATVETLKMNDSISVQLREALMAGDLFPPRD